jgi:polyisoprenyl-phosphate glycosyltransferase
MLSVVVPAHNEAEALPLLIPRLRRVLAPLNLACEVVIVDDGSTDATWDTLQRAARADPRVRGIRLSRNFGHQLALTAGVSAATGDLVVTMDADLQHPPEAIPTLLAKAREGFDVVYAVRSAETSNRSTELFYRALNALTCLDLPVGGADFRLMSRRAIDALLAMPERHRFLRGMTRWLGFPQATVEYGQDARLAGDPKYTRRARMRLAFDAIVAFSALPLRVASVLGFVFALVGALYLVYVVSVGLFTDSAVEGWTSVVGVTLVLGGVQLASIGIAGLYLGRMYDELKGRPLFLVEAETGQAALRGEQTIRSVREA